MSKRRRHTHGRDCDNDTSSGRARGWWIRAKLRRKLFLWFGITIFATAIFTGGLARFLADDQNMWNDKAGITRFAAHLFPADATTEQHRETARALAHDLGLPVRIVAADGATLVDEGGGCERPWVTLSLAAAMHASENKSVHICGPGRSRGRPVVLFLTGLAVLWAMAGMLARRLARPLEDVARVASAIADGDLTARAHVDGRVRGEARALAETVNAMATRIETQLADQKELLAAVSHELRTPLGHLAILADTLDDIPPDDAARARIANDLRREVRELDALTDELLASARLDFRTVARSPVDVTELCRFALQRKGLDVSLLTTTGAPLVDGDRTLLSRAVANLVENAVRHGGGLVSLVVERAGDVVTVTANDSGPGFTDGDVDALFAPFQRGAPSTTARSGLGLGLSLVRRIAEAHDGRAFAHNRSSGGAAVGIALPSSTQPHAAA